MTRRLRTPATLTAIALALLLSGCGSEDPEGKKLPAASATELSRQLASIDARVADRSGGACDDIFEPIPDGNIDSIDKVMAEIPGDVDPEVRAALEESIDKLKQLVDSECEEIATEDERERQQREEEAAAEEERQTTTPTTEEEQPPTTTQPTDTGDEPPPDEGDGEKPPQGKGPDGEGPPGQSGGGGFNAPNGDEGGE